MSNVSKHYPATSYLIATSIKDEPLARFTNSRNLFSFLSPHTKTRKHNTNSLNKTYRLSLHCTCVYHLVYFMICCYLDVATQDFRYSFYFRLY
jgi:hypothetical protein